MKLNPLDDRVLDQITSKKVYILEFDNRPRNWAIYDKSSEFFISTLPNKDTVITEFIEVAEVKNFKLASVQEANWDDLVFWMNYNFLIGEVVEFQEGIFEII